MLPIRPISGLDVVEFKHVAQTWRQRWKRMLEIEIETCARCRGKLEKIASIQDPEAIGRILEHLGESAPAVPSSFTARRRTGRCLS
jgi:hypothetical protein